MQEENIANLLYSREPRQIVSSFFSELPAIQLDSKTKKWHEKHSEQHAYREILLVLTGSVLQRLNDKFYRIPPNSMMLFNHHENHTLGYHDESEGIHCWIVLLPGELYWNILSCKNGEYSYLRRGGLARSELYNDLERSWKNCSDNMPELETKAQVAELNAIVSQILVKIGRQLLHSQSQLRQSNEESARVAIQQVAAYLHEYCDCTVAEMARMAGYSQVHFVRLFRRFTGMKPKKYINMIRFRKYAELKGKLPVKQLADKLGFGSSAALAHWLNYRK